MPWGIERLRLAIVALAVLLVLAILGSIFYGRWRMRHIAQDLPDRLGLQIQQTTRGFVLSKTEQGRPVFTLHAARAVEFKSGSHVSLHDVEIDIYNRQDGKADTIAGESFEYDPRSQIVQSAGEAHIVLHTPDVTGSDAKTDKTAGQLVRVTTHQLTFNQKTGVATCSGEVDFQTGDSNGQAVGAEYDSKQGQLLLTSQVVLMTTMQGSPAVLHASRATYDRTGGLVHLWQPRYSSRQPNGTATGSAEDAVVFLRPDGSAERLNAKGDVRLVSADGLKVAAPVLQAAMTPTSELQTAKFSGGVRFAADQAAQQTTGSAQQLQIDFDAKGHADLAVFDRQVELHQAAMAGKAHVERTSTSDHLTLHLLSSTTGQAMLQTADAMGNAVFLSKSAMPGQAPQQTTVAGQSLHTKFAAGNQLQQMTGVGQTLLKTIAVNGDIDSSTGDNLQIEFAPTKATSGAKGAPATKAPPAVAGPVGDSMTAQSIRSAVQTGHVVLQQIAGHAKSKTSAPAVSTATAARAHYTAANDTLELTGSPTFRDAQMEMTANRMEVERSAGKMISIGAVQATLQPGNRGQNGIHVTDGGLLSGNQPVHIIAERATLTNPTQEAVFTGRARLWQGDDSVEAPVIALSQKMQTLTAYSDTPCARCVISDFPAQTTTVEGGTKKQDQAGKQPPPAPTTFRVLCTKLLYSDAERKASFLHNVQMIGSNGVLTSDQAEVYLSPSAPRSSQTTEKGKKADSPRNIPPQSAVERIVATGNVQLRQPGRDATGTRLVYTASNGHFVLTGDEKHPPKVMDVDQGTVTGPVLTFASTQQAIIVSGTAGHTTTTVTRVQKKQ